RLLTNVTPSSVSGSLSSIGTRVTCGFAGSTGFGAGGGGLPPHAPSSKMGTASRINSLPSSTCTKSRTAFEIRETRFPRRVFCRHNQEAPRIGASSSPSSSTFREMPGDHQSLDLARALVDLRDLCVPEVSLDRVLGYVAIAAEDLDRFPRGAVRHIGCVQL